MEGLDAPFVVCYNVYNKELLMETILYHAYRILDNYSGRWDLMASVYIPVLLNTLS